MISHHFDIPLGSVTKCGPGSEFVVDRIAEATVPPRTVAATHPGFRSHYDVIIVGGGPAGIGAAVGLANRGVRQVLLLERAAELGGIPAKYKAKRGGVPTFVAWPRGRIFFGEEFVEWISRGLSSKVVQVSLESQVTHVCRERKTVTVVTSQGQTQLETDAIVFACGARERTVCERGWIAGFRPWRVFNTMQILQLMDGCGVTPLQRPAIIGSDLIAYAVAAKLGAAGVTSVSMSDNRPLPTASLLARLYFRRWSAPQWQATDDAIVLPFGFYADEIAASTQTDDPQRHDGVIVCGELLPNSELAVAAGLEVSQPDRVPHVRQNELSRPGWFIAGAEQGGFRSAYWCFRDGVRAAAKVAIYLRNRRQR